MIGYAVSQDLYKVPETQGVEPIDAEACAGSHKQQQDMALAGECYDPNRQLWVKMLLGGFCAGTACMKGVSAGASYPLCGFQAMLSGGGDRKSLTPCSLVTISGP